MFKRGQGIADGRDLETLRGWLAAVTSPLMPAVTSSEGTVVGTWGATPFSNDTALDVVETMGEMSPEERGRFAFEVARAALDDVEDARGMPEEVLAVAAILAVNITGQEFLWNAEGAKVATWMPGPIDINASAMVLRALTEALPPDSWWWNGWIDLQDREQARVMVEEVRSVLAQHSEH